MPETSGQVPYHGWSPETVTTSRRAAKRYEPKLGTTIRKVQIGIRAWGPITDEALAEALGLPLNSVRARRVWLRDRHVIIPAGTKRTRAGNQATAWIIAEGV